MVAPCGFESMTTSPLVSMSGNTGGGDASGAAAAGGGGAGGGAGAGLAAGASLPGVGGVGIVVQVLLEVLLGLVELLGLFVRDRDVEQEGRIRLLVVGLQELPGRGFELAAYEEVLGRLEVVLGLGQRLVGRVVRRARQGRDTQGREDRQQHRRSAEAHARHRTTIRGQKSSSIKNEARVANVAQTPFPISSAFSRRSRNGCVMEQQHRIPRPRTPSS